jgi:hypothetical protein
MRGGIYTTTSQRWGDWEAQCRETYPDADHGRGRVYAAVAELIRAMAREYKWEEEQ